MKLLFNLTVLSLTASCVYCWTSTESYGLVESFNRRYCDLDKREKFRFCIIENGAGLSVELYKNCAQQVKFFYTLNELDKFICKISNEKEYEKFIKCFGAAMLAGNRDNPKFFIATEKCLSLGEKYKNNARYHQHEEHHA